MYPQLFVHYQEQIVHSETIYKKGKRTNKQTNDKQTNKLTDRKNYILGYNTMTILKYDEKIFEVKTSTVNNGLKITKSII